MAKKSSDAAKKLKGEIKSFVDDYKDKLLLLAVSFFEGRAKNVIDWLKDIKYLKRKFRAMAVCLGLIAAGLILVVFGAADFVVYKFPVLANGWGKILVGVIAIAVAYIIKKLA